jgi:hypothetical protein
MNLSLYQSFRATAYLLLLAMTPSLTSAQLPKDCIGIGYAGYEPGKPFSAQIITSGKTRTVTGEFKPDAPVIENFVARDRDGRIRDERHPVKEDSIPDRSVSLTWPDGTTRSIPQSTLNQLIMIFDCSAGTETQVRPAMRYATIQHRSEPSSSTSPRNPFSVHFLPNANVKSFPNFRVEDLEIREIQGILAHGVRLTTLGTEADGDWNGKPIRESEQWVSDELAALLAARDKDFRMGRETTFDLANIRREDPDPALFTIPPDYKIDPKIPEDLPRVLPAGSGPPPQH